MRLATGDWHSSPETLRRRVIRCRLCPRLVEFRESVKPKASLSLERYWRRPVPGFGDINGRLLILGLAPAAHGGNRTGRVFTGDSSGRFLVRALYEAGFANKPVSESRDDGLAYTDCYLTAAVKCAPPKDRPTAEEFANCSVHLDSEIALMKNLRAVLALGSMAFNACLAHLERRGAPARGTRFDHGAAVSFEGFPTVYACYHPSPRNTNTGKLTSRMLVRILERIRRDLEPD